MTSRFYIYL